MSDKALTWFIQSMLCVTLFLVLSWPLWIKAAMDQQPELIPAPQEVKEIDLCGHYAVAGTLPNGKGYAGTVLIARVGGNYAVTWVLERGGICRGVGLREGDLLLIGAIQDDALTVFRFRIADDAGKPKLTGVWAQGNQQGQETLTLLRRPSL